MPKVYSMNLREQVLKDCDSGMSSEDTARKYSVNIAASIRGENRPRKSSGYLPTFKSVPSLFLGFRSPFEA